MEPSVRQTLLLPAAMLWLACMALGAAAPNTIAAAGNAAATNAYIEADYRLVRTGTSHIPRIEAALRGVLTRVRDECPLAAQGSPQDPQSTELSDEVIGALVMAVVELDRPAGRAFVTATAHLRWSDRALTHTIQSYVAKVKALDVLAPPGLCADVRGWAASGFQTLTPATLVFSPRFMAAWVGLGELPHALARYESPQDRALAARTERLESRFTDLEAREVETWGMVMNALDLWP